VVNFGLEEVLINWYFSILPPGQWPAVAFSFVHQIKYLHSNVPLLLNHSPSGVGRDLHRQANLMKILLPARHAMFGNKSGQEIGHSSAELSLLCREEDGCLPLRNLPSH
jgi:hypothetical protein